ncbi:MAG: nucleotidyltransferase family protein [Syntrophothermus sp.]
MKFGIIAAGEGSRLKQEGITVLKPMVSICGEMMIDRLISIARENEFESVNIIINEESEELKGHLVKGRFGIPVNLIVKSTPSSMHSFFELSALLKDSSFCLTTADTVFDENEFRSFIAAACSSEDTDGTLAVTDFVDDEKPLYVRISEDDIIDEFSDEKNGCRFVTGGIYFFRSGIYRLKREAEEKKIVRLRNFLRLAAGNGIRLAAYRFSKIIDVDHAADIREAEKFLTGQ